MKWHSDIGASPMWCPRSQLVYPATAVRTREVSPWWTEVEAGQALSQWVVTAEWAPHQPLGISNTAAGTTANPTAWDYAPRTNSHPHPSLHRDTSTLSSCRSNSDIGGKSPCGNIHQLEGNSFARDLDKSQEEPSTSLRQSRVLVAHFTDTGLEPSKMGLSLAKGLSLTHKALTFCVNCQKYPWQEQRRRGRQVYNPQ